MKQKNQEISGKTNWNIRKQILILFLSVGIVSGASAQHFHGGGFSGGHVYYGGGFRTGVVVGGYYPYYGYPGFYLGLGYPFYGFPYGLGYGYGRVSKLQMQISDIKQDYADRIESVKMDNTLTGKERRQQIRALKHERDDAVENAKRNYWRTGQTQSAPPAQSGPSVAPTQSNPTAPAAQSNPSSSNQLSTPAPYAN